MTRFSLLKAASLLFLLAAFVVGVLGQNKSANKLDYSGEWLLDLKKSDEKAIPSRPDLPIKISHHDPELRITQTSEVNGKLVERESVYYTDERGETNQATTMITTNPGSVTPEDLEKQSTKSRTRWSGDKLITVSTLRLTAAGHVLEYDAIDEWKLSKDGQVLTKLSRLVYRGSTTVFVPALVPDTKKVYKRS